MVWANNNYKYKRPITLLSSKVSGGSNLSSFPALISTTVADLKVTGSGGKVTNSSGFDIIFYDPTETTQLFHEIESYTSTTGAIVFWVNIPTLNVAGNTVIWMYYGWPAVPNSFQSTASSVWDANYVAVYHLQQNPAGGAPQMLDSTTNANHMTVNGSMTSANQVAGAIGGSLNFTVSSQYLTNADAGAGDTLRLGSATNVTLSAWVKPSSLVGENHIISKSTYASNLGYELFLANTGLVWMRVNGPTFQTATASAIGTAAFSYVAGVFSGGTAETLYLNGAASTPGSHAAMSVSASLNAATLASASDSVTTYPFLGLMDEVRISKTNRTAGWIITEYNNQNSPATFLTVGNATIRGLDMASRFKLAVVVITGHDLSARLRLVASAQKNAASRFKLRSVPIPRDMASRLVLLQARQRDTAARLRVLVSRQRDQAGRLRLASPATRMDLRQRFNIVAPLSLYGTNTATATLSTANGFDTVTGGTATSTTSSLSSGTTGFGEIYSQGSSPAWATGNGAGAIGSPSGHGWLYDATTLVGQMMIAGNWVQKATLGTTVSFTSSLFGRWYKYNAGAYTPIGSSSLTAQPLTPPSTTALTLYGTTTASSTLSTADTFASVTGAATGSQILTHLGTATGWGQVYAQGNAGAWPALGAIGTPDGHGWLWDVTTLEGGSMVAGTWGFSSFFNMNDGSSVTATMTARAYRRSSSGTYTLIGSIPLGSTTFTGTLVDQVFTNTSLSALSFGVGDKLYMDLWANVTVSSGSSSTTGIQIVEGVSSTQGRANDAQLTTPGFQTGGATFTLPSTPVVATNFNTGDKLYMDLWANITGAPASAATLSTFVSSSTSLGVAGDAELDAPGFVVQPGNTRTLDSVTRLRLASAAQTKDSSWRFRLSALQTKDATGRYRLASAAKTGDTTSRFKVAATKNVDLASRYKLAIAKLNDSQARLKLASTAQNKDSQTRLKVAATNNVDTALRFKMAIQKANDTKSRLKLASVAQAKDTKSRLKLAATNNVDTALRFKLQGALALKDSVMRVKLAATKKVDTASRYRLASVAGLHDQAVRYRLAVTRAVDIQSRFRVQGTRNVDLQTRFKLFIAKPNDSQTRYKLASAAQNKDATGRYRLSATRNADLIARFKLSGIIQNKDLSARYRLSALHTQDLAARYKLASVAGLHDAATRLRLAATQTRDAATRLRLAATQTRDAESRLRLASAAQLRDMAARVRLAIQKKNDLTARLRLASATGLRDVSGRLRLQITKQNDSAARLRLASANVLKDAPLRFRVSTTTLRDSSTRLRLSAQRTRDVQTRYRLSSVAQLRDVTSRLRLASAPQLRDVTSRLRLASAAQRKDSASRLALRATATRDTESRLRLASSPNVRDTAERFRLASAATTHDTAVRVRISVQKTPDLTSRLRLLASIRRDIGTRFIVQTVNARIVDLSTRVRLLAQTRRDSAVRFRLALLKDSATRLRLSVTSAHDLATRLRLASASQLRDGKSRLKLASSPQLRDGSGRLRLASAAASHDTAVRLRISVTGLRDSQERFRLASAAQLKDTDVRIKIAVLRQLDTAQRLRLASAPKMLDSSSRVKLASAAQRRDVAALARFAIGRTLDIRQRLVLASAPKMTDLRWRFLLSTVFLVRLDALVRFPLAILSRRETALRFVTRAPISRDLASRYRLGAMQTADTGCRFTLKLEETNIIMSVRSGNAQLSVRSGTIVMQVPSGDIVLSEREEV